MAQRISLLYGLNAPEFYDNLVQTRSYVALALQFVFGSRSHFEANFDNEIQRNMAVVSGGPDK